MENTAAITQKGIFSLDYFNEGLKNLRVLTIRTPLELVMRNGILDYEPQFDDQTSMLQPPSLVFVPVGTPINIDLGVPPPLYFDCGREYDKRMKELDHMVFYKAEEVNAQAVLRGKISDHYDGRLGHYIIPVMFFRLREHPPDFPRGYFPYHQV